MRARVVAAGFGDYTTGLRRTQPRFPPAMQYALMERWNDCTHTFVFGFGEMTLTPVDYAAITGLRFIGPVPPLDARYQTTALGAQLDQRVPHAPPRHMCLLEGLTREDLEAEYRGFSMNDFLSVGDFPTYFSSRIQARLPEILEYTQRIPRYLAHCHHTYASGEDPEYWRSFLNDRELSDVPAQRYQEICQRFGFARSYIGRLYSERHE
ncbi:hypothetical protein JCGZ_10923 [Jatropha curcas]|uniref:Aminotransferase-like plant mobile domain-containing protein n=1 Tax=Jatropha curcas TaxID=180498 RepID=A0A067KIC6_JATCU|nr:hypothetical protein JCGZ_10923 [Jatropha curcas]